MRKLAALLLLIVPLAANAWWNDEWNFRKEITLDLSAAGANIAGSPADVPVLVRLHLGNFGYFADTQPDGADLRFVAGDDKTPLKFHIERYDVASNIAFVWVQVPRLAGGAATEKIFLYYGNPDAPAGADAPGTYDANQVLVYHFGAEGAPQTRRPTGTIRHLHCGAERASLIGAGVKLTGAGSITAPSTASLRVLPDQGATLSAWVRIDAPQADAFVIEMADANRAFAMGVNGRRCSPGCSRLASAGERAVRGHSGCGQWHHVAPASANRLALFVDGAKSRRRRSSFGDCRRADDRRRGERRELPDRRDG